MIIGVGCGDVYIGLPGKAFCSCSYFVKHAVHLDRVCSFFSLSGRAFQLSIEKILVHSTRLACGYHFLGKKLQIKLQFLLKSACFVLFASKRFAGSAYVGLSNSCQKSLARFGVCTIPCCFALLVVVSSRIAV